ncbi:MAG: Plasma membrane low glucose sensor [Pycnora praestabilis]|nr:MAG: Plasma membrane low glucose sensor [Pycnora praestabilis]
MGPALRPPEGAAGSAAPAIFIGLFAAFGGILYGYDTGTIGGIITMTYWRNNFSMGYVNPHGDLDVTANQTAEIVSILSAGTFFGALASSAFGDLFGRRQGLIVSCFIFIAGVIMQSASVAIPLFVAGRFFAGLGVGLVSSLVPLYQSETAPNWIRGTVVGTYQLAITLGLLLASIVNNATKNRMDSGSYRIPIAVQFAWALILIVGMYCLPESPRYLVKSGKHNDAQKSLARLRRLDPEHQQLILEFQEIQENFEHEKMLEGGKPATYLDCFRTSNSVRKRLITGCVLQSLQQLVGINFIFYYGTRFFQSSGIHNPFVIALITNIVNVCSCLPGLYLIDKWGRRPLLLWGAVGMCVTQLIVASVGTAIGLGDETANKTLITFVCVYIFFFECSWGPVAWVVTGELYPLRVRAKCMSMTTASNWLLNWAIAYATPYLVDEGPGNADLGTKVFFIWGGFCAVATAFVFCFIYETKGLALEEVDQLYVRCEQPWKQTKRSTSAGKSDDAEQSRKGQGQRLQNMPVLANTHELESVRTFNSIRKETDGRIESLGSRSRES